jgi:hypothetical protein
VKVFDDMELLRNLKGLSGMDWAVIYPEGDIEFAYWLILENPDDRITFEGEDTGYVTEGQNLMDHNGVIFEYTPEQTTGKNFIEYVRRTIKSLQQDGER